MDVWDFFSYFAFLLLGKLLLQEAITWSQIIYVHFFSNLLWKKKDFVQDYGQWAVVTGSSSGIGKNYARELAKRGLNIILISNEEEKLQEVSQDIESSFKVKTKVIVADFSEGEEEHQKVFKNLEDLDIGILVNNVGAACGLPNKLEEMTRKQMWDLMMINVCAATSVTHFILPIMKRNKRGIIVNIASLASLSPTPFATLYGASKAFILSFSDALKWECQDTGVEIQTVCPGFVDTKIIDSNARNFPSVFFPSPEKFAKYAVDTIGKVSTTSGFFPHDVQRALLEVLPMCLRTLNAKIYFQVKQEDEGKKKKEN